MNISQELVEDVRKIHKCSCCKNLTFQPDFNFIAVLAFRLREEIVFSRETHYRCDFCDFMGNPTGATGLTIGPAGHFGILGPTGPVYIPLVDFTEPPKQEKKSRWTRFLDRFLDWLR